MKFSGFILIPVSLLLLISGCNKESEKPPDPVTDIEGNIYKTIKAGSQIWMAENLKSTLLNDSTEIPLVTDSLKWRNLTTPGYCWYNNDDLTNRETYGALYNGYTVSSGKLCPAGWHVPIAGDWQLLSEFLLDSLSGGGKLKESGTIHWMSPNKGATNASGFTALPSGIRYFDGSFTAIQYYTGIWTASESGSESENYLGLYYKDASLTFGTVSKKDGLSVRCVKD
jgi:uncharacterized protein (TIGR02145 family)